MFRLPIFANENRLVLSVEEEMNAQLLNATLRVSNKSHKPPGSGTLGKPKGEERG